MNLVIMVSVLALGAVEVHKFSSISAEKNIFTKKQKTMLAQLDAN